jgi:diguanylate cyclase (GGDEF)-like protein/PAS domain S-box-containing protein
MAEHWQQLVANFAVVALFISAWVHGQFIVNRHPRFWRQFGLGLIMGVGAVASMLLGIAIDGALFDLRLSLIAIAGFFGGPVAGVVAVAIAAVFRALQVGGPATALAVLAIVAAGTLGVVTALLIGRRRIVLGPALLAIGVAGITLGVSMAVRPALGTQVSTLTLPLALMNAAATAVAAVFILRHRLIERERDLLRAAFEQSPDIQYIKTTESRFAAVNTVLARASGVATAAELVGRTDADILKPESAAAILADDRQIVTSSRAKIDFEELVHGTAGEEIWYRTSKVPLRNIDREVVGLAGWTRDITAQKQLEREVTESRNQLRYVLAEISDGIAMFDADGILVYSNEQYKSLFPRTAQFRTPGTHLRTILEKVLEVEEQVVPKGREAAWLDEVTNSITHYSEEEVELFDGRWLYLRTRPTAEGAALVVVSDVTKIKQAEAALRNMTDQLKLLATTDGLTGLTNRRAFDTALESELARCRRSGEPLSLLLADVDRFKAYNDIYGHQAGDDVLRKVGQCLKDALRRPADVAARYGGEEFVAILPGTDEDGAFFIADAFRESLFGLGIVHRAGEKGVVTVSVGLATFTDRDAGMNSTDLVRRADDALYNAKGAGRDRVTGWRPRHEVRPVKGARA